MGVDDYMHAASSPGRVQTTHLTFLQAQGGWVLPDPTWGGMGATHLTFLQAQSG